MNYVATCGHEWTHQGELHETSTGVILFSMAKTPERKPSVRRETPEEPLANAIRSVALANGLTLDMLAKKVEVPCNTLRTWLSRNRYPEAELRSLLQHLSMDTPECARKEYNFDLAKPRRLERRERAGLIQNETQGLGAALELIDRRVTSYQKQSAGFAQEVEAVFQNMSTEDVFAFCSLDRIPHEMSQTCGPHGIAEVIAQAVTRSAFFVYLFPTEAVLNNLDKIWVHDGPTSAMLRRKYNEFCFRLVGLQQCTAEQVARQILYVPIDDTALIAPKFKFVLFAPRAAEYHRRSYAAVPVGNHSASVDVQVPLDDKFTEMFVSFVRDRLIALNSDSRRSDTSTLAVDRMTAEARELQTFWNKPSMIAESVAKVIKLLK